MSGKGCGEWVVIWLDVIGQGDIAAIEIYTRIDYTPSKRYNILKEKDEFCKKCY